MYRNNSITLFIILAIITSACSKKVVRTAAAETKTYLALGDSYTIGQGVQPTERFPFLLAATLRNEGIPLAEPRYIATSGWTTLNLQNAIESENPPSTFDLVTLLIGVNDQYQFRDTTGYRLRFAQLLTKAITLAKGRMERVFVLSIPDYSATPFVPPSDKQRVRTQIDQFNTINKDVTVNRGVTYVDITPLTREVVNDPSLLANDQLHYSRKEHLEWVKLLVPLVRERLK